MSVHEYGAGLPTTAATTSSDVGQTEPLVKNSRSEGGVVIGGVRIFFPSGKEPFPPQKAVMNTALLALKNRQNALLESPTGTGKTLALLTSTLSWQMDDYNKKEMEYLATKAVTLASNSMLELPTPPVKKQIYYLSRTHTQLKQVIAQLRAVHPSLASVTKMSILGSKDHLCVNSRARDWKSGWDGGADAATGIDDACQKLRKGRQCGEGLRVEAAVSALSGLQTFDIEDAVRAGKEIRACSYYAARHLSQSADIIFSPYNYLLDKGIREAMGLSELKDAIVIIDEGHNMADVCRDGASFLVSQRTLNSVVGQLLGCKESTSSGLYDNLLDLAKGLQVWFKKKVDVLQSMRSSSGGGGGRGSFYRGDRTSDKDNVFSAQEVMTEFERSFGLDASTIPLYVEFLKEIAIDLLERESFLSEPAASDSQNPTETRLLGSASISLLRGFLRVAEILQRKNEKGELIHVDDYKVIIDLDAGFGSRTSDPSLQFLCLNAAIGFRDLAKDTHSVLVTSGTLSPMASFASELGVPFQYRVEAKHVIDPSQLFVGALGSFQGQSLESTYQAQSIDSYKDAVAQVILHSTSTLPRGAGTLVFFPSYSLMEKLLERWRNTNVLDENDQFRDSNLTVFREPRSARDCEQMLASYLAEVEGKISNAVLLCVCRGKVSEGLDFSDDKARLVILVGIPYPALMDTGVKLKKEYQDLKSKRSEPGMPAVETGAQWYESQAWRAVNQAIGRVIRHKNDWGAILFLDPRFKYPKNKLMLPKWVGGVVQEFDGYERAHVPLRLFMSNLSQNPPGGAAAAAVARERASAPTLAPAPPPEAAAMVHPFFAPFSTAGKKGIELEYEREEAPVGIKAEPKGTLPKRKKAKN